MRARCAADGHETARVADLVGGHGRSDCDAEPSAAAAGDRGRSRARSGSDGRRVLRPHRDVVSTGKDGAVANARLDRVGDGVDRARSGTCEGDAGAAAAAETGSHTDRGRVEKGVRGGRDVTSPLERIDEPSTAATTVKAIWFSANAAPTVIDAPKPPPPAAASAAEPASAWIVAVSDAEIATAAPVVTSLAPLTFASVVDTTVLLVPAPAPERQHLRRRRRRPPGPGEAPGLDSAVGRRSHSYRACRADGAADGRVLDQRTRRVTACPCQSRSQRTRRRRPIRAPRSEPAPIAAAKAPADDSMKTELVAMT